MSTATAWLAALALALLLSAAHLLDGPDDHSTEAAQALAVEDAYRAADQRARFERAAQAACGPITAQVQP